MSQKHVVLYGHRPYGRTLYNITEDFETFNVSLAETMSMADARTVDTITKALSDIIALSDADKTTVGTKVFSDTATLTEALVKSLSHALSDSFGMTESDTIHAYKVITDSLLTIDSLATIGNKPLADSMTVSDTYANLVTKALSDAFTILESRLTVNAVKNLTDFLLLKEWITITLKRANPWVDNTAATTTVPLYGRTQYGRALYGYTPITTWRKPTTANSWTTGNPTYPSFTNNDGESHQG